MLHPTSRGDDRTAAELWDAGCRFRFQRKWVKRENDGGGRIPVIAPKRPANLDAMTAVTNGAFDVAVIGAGCFGAWAAWHLASRGRQVILVDQYGPANARASSGGETRVIRMGYGADAIYTRLARSSLTQWTELFMRAGHPELFQRTGVLWMARGDDPRCAATLEVLGSHGVPHEKIERDALERRFPQIAVDPRGWGILEPESGVLLARRAVQAVVEDAVSRGTALVTAAVLPPDGSGGLASVSTTRGETIRARMLVFACGPWLGRVLPDVLAGRITPTRQEVFFFGVPPGDERFASPAMPAWIDFGQGWYGVPDVESRGFKVACDDHGPVVDPDGLSRIPSAEGIEAARTFVATRFPDLRDAPIVESRVCQYENTSSGDFVIDRHPTLENAWVLGGGSGHGFKHGPAVGELIADCIDGRAPIEPRFALAGKSAVRRRQVY